MRPATLPGLSESSDRDTQSISDLLKERQSQFAFDLGIVIDAKGNVLGRNDQTEAFRESLADDPLVRPAIAKAAPFSGYWRQGDRLYQAAIMPLQQDQTLVGFILLAQAINNEFCQQVAKISGAQIAFWLPTEPGCLMAASTAKADEARSNSSDQRPLLAASSFDEATAKTLQDEVATDASLAAIGSGKSLPRVALTFSGQRWIAKLTPTAAEGEAQLGSLLALTSIDRIVASYRDILNWVLVGAVASILIALLLSYLLAKGILRPVRAMALAAEQAAAGNYKTQLGLRGSDELARLSRAFDSLLSDLREKSDMEGYVGNLSRFLPDPGAEPVRAAPPARPESPPREPARVENVAVVGLEFRQFGRRDDALTRGAGVEPLRQRRSSRHANCQCGRRKHADAAGASLRTDVRRIGPADSGPAGVVRAARSVARRRHRPAGSRAGFRGGHPAARSAPTARRSRRCSERSCCRWIACFRKRPWVNCCSLAALATRSRQASDPKPSASRRAPRQERTSMH